MTRDLNKPDPLSVKEAAAEAGVKTKTIHNAIARGQLRPIFPRRTHALSISRAEFERWRLTRRKPGRPGPAPKDNP